MKEQWLHQIWGNRLYESLTFEPHPCIPEGVLPVVADPGSYNLLHGGPDFFNVKLRVGSIVWVGNGEMHHASSDWFRHHHHLDPAYNNVILHIVLNDDQPVALQSGTPPITCTMRVNPRVMAMAEHLSEAPQIPRCGTAWRTLPERQRQDWIEQLCRERMEMKLRGVEERMQALHGDAAGVLHRLLLRYLGSNVNNEAFEQIALRVPPVVLRKHADSLLSLEAMLLGTAGLLSDPEGLVPDGASDYFARLCAEYAFLAHKYGLTAIAPSELRMMRLRPASFPHRRLAYAAALYHRWDNLPARLLRATSIAELQRLLSVSPSDYWLRHYNWQAESRTPMSRLSREAVQSIAINAVLPMQRYVRGVNELQGRSPSPAADAVSMSCEHLPPERNSVVERFVRIGMPLSSARDSQALLQLYQSYCRPRRCWSCPIGRASLQSYAPGSLHPAVREATDAGEEPSPR